MSCFERIILTTTTGQFHEDFYNGNALIDFKIEAENLISLLPLFEESFKIIKDNFMDTEMNNSSTSSCLLPLDDEIFKTISLIWSSINFVKSQFQLRISQQKQENVVNFYAKELQKLNENISKFEPFFNFLSSLKSDAQIQSKFTKNLFHFLIEFYLDKANLAKVAGILKRILSRFIVDEERGVGKKDTVDTADMDTRDMRDDTARDVKDTSINDDINTNNTLTDNTQTNLYNNLLFDSIKCLNLPVKSHSSILMCRKCHRTSFNTKISKSRRELIFSANWQPALWKMRCQCGSLRRQINFQ